MESSLSPHRLVHDFKNQLGIVLGYSELLIDELADDDPRKPDLQEINKAAKAAMALLEQLKTALPSEEP